METAIEGLGLGFMVWVPHGILYRAWCDVFPPPTVVGS